MPLQTENSITPNTSAREMRVILRAERYLAFDSPDHIMPWGTRISDSTNPRFNTKLWRLYASSKIIKVLDIGCAGGAFVKSCIDDGHFAVGLEGSDFSKLHRRSAWATMPEFLFTCDVTYPWELSLSNGETEEPILFDVVTAWDFMEHLSDSDLPKFIDAVKKHLAPGGLFILSIANHEDIHDGVRLHQIVQPKPWWRSRFQELGLCSVDDLAKYFSMQFVRGSRKDDERSFHFVLTNNLAQSPSAPVISYRTRMLDMWLGSKPQKLLKLLITGEHWRR